MDKRGMGTGIGRRGILAAAGAAVAAIAAAKAAAQPVAADNGTWTLPYTGSTASFNADNAAVTVTQTTAGKYAIHGISDGLGSIGVVGTSVSGTGVSGASSNGYGVYGNTQSAATAGVLGVGAIGNGGYLYTTATGNSKAGGYGEGNGDGTFGLLGSGYSNETTNTKGGVGVQGQDAQYGVVGLVDNIANTIAAYGNNTSTNGTNNIGVYGKSTTGYAMRAEAAGNIGLYATSTGSYGVLGITTAGAPYSGLTGTITTATGAAFAGGATQATAYAAYFTGKVNIDGPFLVNGVQKFTLKHADGTSRLVSGALSIEPVVEDFGTGQLASGAATVTLDADFREVAETGDYAVFLTPYDGVGALRAARRTATGFAVEEIGGTSSGAFAWRVVAKPKDGGGKVARLAKYESPNIKIPGINGEPLPAAPVPAVAAAPPPVRLHVAAPAPNPAPQPRAATAPATSDTAAAPAAPQPTAAPPTTGQPATAPNPVPPSRP